MKGFKKKKFDVLLSMIIFLKMIDKDEFLSF